jgi:septal ring factor EnvC (AmiA/AmiB activator)
MEQDSMRTLPHWLRPWLSLVALIILCAGVWTATAVRQVVVLAQSASGSAQVSEEERKEIQNRIDELSKKLSEAQQEKNSLSSTIKLLDSKIQLNEQQIRQTQLEIRVTQSEINDLNERVEGLKSTLSELSMALIHRVQQQYKTHSSDPMSRLFATTGAEDYFKQDKYLAKARAHTQELIVTTEEKRQDYDARRLEKEDKQDDLRSLETRLEQQQADLDQQKEDKRRLLEVTQNNEKIYQQQLAAAQAEAAGLLLIKAGKGNEVEVGKVKEGDRIATIITGSSLCSSGTHLHFEVIKDGNYSNPFQWLSSSVSLINNTSDPVGGSGSWPWPVPDAAKINQGYGMTWYARVMRAYGGGPHTGVDLVSKTGSSREVVAVSSGTLYRGAIRCGGGDMRYVKVKHDNDSSVSSVYVHVNY